MNSFINGFMMFIDIIFNNNVMEAMGFIFGFYFIVLSLLIVVGLIIFICTKLGSLL